MDPKFLVDLQGKTYPLYGGILSDAHERGLQSIETQLVQIPGADNEYTAIVKAVVRMKDGSVFEEIGDASPRNVNARIATALIRMAATRAKGRALRDAINVGQTMLEELGDLPEAEMAAPKPGTAKATSKPAAPLRAKEPPTWAHPETGEVVSRQDLLSGLARRVQEADQLGVAHDVHDYDAMTNEELAAWGEVLRLAIAEARAEASDPGKARTRAAVERTEQPAPKPAPGGQACIECGALLTAGQITVSRKKFNILLCPEHQRAHLAAQRSGGT